MKDEIADDAVFKSHEGIVIDAVFRNIGLFIRYWDVGMIIPTYYQTPSPGSKKGVNTNTSIISGMNLGINKYISEEHQKAALEVIKYFTSEEVQREIIVKKYFLYSAISKLYDEEEVCSLLICSLVKNARTVNRVLEIDESQEYVDEITRILNEVLFGNKDPKDAVDEIVTIKTINHFSLKSSIGLTMFILLVSTVIFIVMEFSIFIQKSFDVYFRFFSRDLYWMYGSGILLILSSELFKFGPLTNFKCQMGFSLFFIGLTVTYIPIICKLLTSFPDLGYGLKIYCQIHRKRFIIYCICAELALNLLFIASPFVVENRLFYIDDNSELYSRCTVKNSYANVIVFIEIIEKIIMITAILLLSFCEWNVIEIFDNIRAVVMTIYINVLLLVLYIIDLYIPLNRFDIICTLSSFIIIVMAFSNYVSIYMLRMFILKNTNKLKKDPISNLYSNSTLKSITVSQTHSSKTDSQSSVIGKIINYHYTPYSIINESYNPNSIKNSNILTEKVVSSANYSFN